MHNTIRFGFVLVALSICSSATLKHATAAVIVGGWDLARGGFDSVREAPEQAGVRALIELISPGAIITATNELTDAYLSTVDVLLIGGQTSNTTFITPLTAAEQTALFNFVVAGGNAAIVTEREPQGGPGGDATRESMIDAFGLDTMGSSSAPTATFLNALHPIADGPFGTITQFGLNGAGWYDNLGPYAVALATEDDGNQPVVAVIEDDVIALGSGRVVFLSDANALDAEELNSFTLAGNGLAYLIPIPEPCTMVLAGIGLCALAVCASRRQRNRIVGAR